MQDKIITYGWLIGLLKIGEVHVFGNNTKGKKIKLSL
jgi:hypothetical protein